MTIHRIRLLGDPILRTKCETIAQPGSAAVRMIIDDLRDTLRDWQSRFGTGRAIAAPQIGAPVRIVYVEMDRPWPLINPEIVDIGTEDFTVWDDCFSFPNLMIRVQRAYRIRVRFQDLKGLRIEFLVITEPMREMLRDNPSPNALRAEARKNGMIYLQEDGLRQVTINSSNLGGRGDITLFVPELARDRTDVPLVILLNGVYGSHWAWALRGGAHRTAARLPPIAN